MSEPSPAAQNQTNSAIKHSSARPRSDTTRPRRRSRATGESAVATMVEADVAARLMSETAHDLRSPLTTIRESVRLVSDGSLGELNPQQTTYLNAAIDQCDCMEQMVSEMVQVERLRSGLPRVQRRWVPVKDIRSAVDETLRPWALPRGISILWDGADDPNLSVFADVSMLRRLIVNLATNSIRHSADGSPVLIRLQPHRIGESILWTIIDQGTGIAAADLSRIAQRQVSMGNGEGLGISISRQLAALHFSPLLIRSRKGFGTQVSFHTAASGPSSVAEHWGRWRAEQRGPRKQPVQRGADEANIANQASELATSSSFSRNASRQRQVRLDPPSMAIELGSDHVSPRSADRCAAGTVTIGAAMTKSTADQFDRSLQGQLQMFDLVYRVSTRRWVWVLDVDDRMVSERIGAIEDAAKATIPNVRLRWSAPQMIPIDPKRTISRLSDLLIRQSLSASTSAHAADNNQVRLGTAPIEQSTIAAVRLEVELGRMANRMSWQSLQLKNQSRNLRPDVS